MTIAAVCNHWMTIAAVCNHKSDVKTSYTILMYACTHMHTYVWVCLIGGLVSIPVQTPTYRALTHQALSSLN